MPIDRVQRVGRRLPDDEFAMYLSDPDQMYTVSQVEDLLEEAEELGFSLDPGDELDGMTVRQLEVLVRQRQ